MIVMGVMDGVFVAMLIVLAAALGSIVVVAIVDMIKEWWRHD